MTKEEKIEQFNPNRLGLTDSGVFGLPFDVDDSELVILPVPWDVTTSYRDGTSNGPEAILWASRQVDLYYAGIKNAWQMGIAMSEVPLEWADLNKHYRKKANTVIEKLENGAKEEDSEVAGLIQEINEQCTELNEYVYSRSQAQLEAGKLVAVLGGDHSTPLGLIRALSEIHNDFGILQIDAHADLRPSYEGFSYSHASLMHNTMEVEQVSKLVSVGLRDVCEQEMNTIFNSQDRIVGFFDEHLKSKLFNGENWNSICDTIISELPKKVYISFDIDGLDPNLCPNTGTPVPGGLSFEQATFLIKKLVQSGREIIGFDLCEVAPSESEWDTIVGARMLYHLCNQTGLSNGRMPETD